MWKNNSVYLIIVIFLGLMFFSYRCLVDSHKETNMTSIDIKAERYKRTIKAQDKSLNSLTLEYLKNKERYRLFVDSLLNR